MYIKAFHQVQLLAGLQPGARGQRRADHIKPAIAGRHRFHPFRPVPLHVVQSQPTAIGAREAIHLLRDGATVETIIGRTQRPVAARAGIQSGDVIVEVQGQRCSGLAELFRRIWACGVAGAA